MIGKKPLAIIVVAFLLLAVPYLSFIDFDSSKPLRFGESDKDDHLPMKDSDRDGMADDWEMDFNLDPFDAADAHEDLDGDGLENLKEYLLSTDPTAIDTDEDGMPDGWEVKYDLDPLEKTDASGDLDNDGYDFSIYGGPADDPFTNLEEFLAGSSPVKADTDADGMPDAWEFYFNLNASNPADADEDADNDGFDADHSGSKDQDEYFTNYEEFLNNTHPLRGDSDADSMPDGWEATYGLLLLIPDGDRDPDGDGLLNYGEFSNPEKARHGDRRNSTDPRDPDTDDDGLSDGQECNGGMDVFGENWSELQTDPTDRDTDGDGMDDGWETNFTTGWRFPNGTILFLDPRDPDDALNDPDNDTFDIDGDGSIADFEQLHNLGEYENGSSPVLSDSDADGMPDVWEGHFELNASNPADAFDDTDGDGFTTVINNEEIGPGPFTNLEEFTFGTDPVDPDTDNDAIWDGWEVFFGLDPLNRSDAKEDTDRDGMDLGGDFAINSSEEFTNREEFVNATFPTMRDTDGDSMWDVWEIRFGLDPLSAADREGDPDNDGLVNYLEFNNTLHANSAAHYSAETDSILWSNPQDPDTDDDWITDGDELDSANGFVTDPSNPDTDLDMIPDGWELNESTYEDPAQRFDPTDPQDGLADFDGDSFDGNGDDWIDPTTKEFYPNFREYRKGTDPRNPDTDGDGMPDGWEHYYKLDKLNYDDRWDDLDGDGLFNYEEYLNGTKPNIRDSDYDSLSDSAEVFTHGTDPADEDTDGDDMPDGWEVGYGLDPLYNDANGNLDDDGMDIDGDGKISSGEELTNREEFNLRTDPGHLDTDGDGIPDVWEMYFFEWKEVGFRFNPTNRADGSMDPDEDGLDNYGEYANPGLHADDEDSTHPFVNDTDGDGLFDGEECHGSGNSSGYLTDPTTADTDDDDMPDGWEARMGLDPTDADDRNGDPDANEEWYDFDGDGERDADETLLNYEEYLYGSDPLNWDTDGDDLSDVWEARYFD